MLVREFLSGCRSAGANVETIHLSTKRMVPCTCGHRFACWVETPGRCVYHAEDDVRKILARMGKADAIVFATPVYVEGMTGLMRTFLDRTLPLVQPYIERVGAGSRHPLRLLRQGLPFVLISVCGHYEISNFSALVHTFERIARRLHGRLVGRVLRPHGMVLRHRESLDTRYERVMGAVRYAGRELAQDGLVKKQTEQRIRSKLMSKDSFIRQTNQMWDRAIVRKRHT